MKKHLLSFLKVPKNLGSFWCEMDEKHKRKIDDVPLD